MPAYFGAKQLFRNRLGGGAVREMYLGSKQVMGFSTADYSTNEWVGEKAQAGDYPTISADGTTATIGTNEYNPGHAFTKYYCDHIEISMLYGGGLIIYDCEGNEVVNIAGTISFSYSSGKWTVGSKCFINGTQVFNSSYTSTDVAAERLGYKVYFDTNTRKWTVVWNGGTYTGNAQEWKPTYARVSPQVWSLASTMGVSFFNGYIYVLNMNRARGYPQAK